MEKYVKRVFSLMLVLCMAVGGLPCMKRAETANAGEVTNYAESGEVVHGFGNKIKNKKVKAAKVNVNKGSKNGEAWNRQMIQAEMMEGSGEMIKVVIIDSGINFSTDLNVAIRKNFIPEDERSVLYEDPTGHGTAVAGLIGALDNGEGVTGVNPGVELYSARVLDEKLEAPVERIVEAIDWAIEQDADIINMSFGISKNVAELENAIERAAEADILLIAAAGDGEEIAYPAAYDEVIAVGSVTAAGIPAEHSAGGDALELMAPGENILSSGIFGGVMGMSGTSMAAPHVAGAASVLMELNPDMPADYIRMLLNYSANLYGDSNEYGNGVIDLGYAIEINDKFRKLYEKHIDKAEKNEKKKEKQKEKFWGEVLKTIPENEKAVEAFTEVEVVEGMWAGTGHTAQINYGLQDSGVSFTAEQMKVLAKACNYPDVDADLKDMDDNPYHGFLWSRKKVVTHLATKDRTDYLPQYDSNYLANYVFLTKLARANGVVENVSQGNMFTNDYNRIYADFKDGMVGSATWSQVLSAAGVSDTGDNRKMYIYGIAIHLVGDVFAHSAWAWNDSESTYARIKHPNADNVTIYPKRYEAATQVIKNVLGKAYSGSEGTLSDFVIPKTYFGSGNSQYFLGNFAPYAQEANSNIYNIWISFFSCVDLRTGIGDNYNYEGDTYYIL